MVTTRKISKNYTQKEMRQESQWCTTKKLMSTKEGSNEENEEQKGIRYTENKQQGKVSLLSIVTLNVNELNSPTKDRDWQD